MTLADLTLPISYENARQLALVFTPQLAARLAQLHAEHGSPNCVPVPRALTDGRLMLCADVLTEIEPGGLLHAMWQAADQRVLGQAVEVMAWADAVALLSEAVPSQFMQQSQFTEPRRTWWSKLVSFFAWLRGR